MLLFHRVINEFLSFPHSFSMAKRDNKIPIETLVDQCRKGSDFGFKGCLYVSSIIWIVHLLWRLGVSPSPNNFQFPPFPLAQRWTLLLKESPVWTWRKPTSHDEADLDIAVGRPNEKPFMGQMPPCWWCCVSKGFLNMAYLCATVNPIVESPYKGAKIGQIPRHLKVSKLWHALLEFLIFLAFVTLQFNGIPFFNCCKDCYCKMFTWPSESSNYALNKKRVLKP